MKVLMLAADEGGCGKYRIREPARVLKELGVDVEVAPSLPVIADVHKVTNLTTVQQINLDVDLIVFPRPLDNAMHACIVQAKKQGIATIVEMDDDIAATHPKNGAYKHFYGPKTSGAQWLWKAAREADYITASTPALLGKYAAPHGRGAVLRNAVPDSIFDITPRYERVGDMSMIGWTGSIASHPTDLEVTKGAVADIVRDYKLAFSVVGEMEGVPEKLRLDEGTLTYSPGWVSLDKYYEAMSLSMDVGIVPLELNTFNAAKSWLKGMEMAALGIPFVASDTYEYRVFEAYGVGRTASNPSDWRRALSRILDNPDKAISKAKETRDKIKAEYTYEVNATKWVQAYEEAIAYRKANN